MLLIILALILIHGGIINRLEKILVQSFSNAPWTKRPLCTNDGYDCFGMPSGHAEVAILIAVLLFMIMRNDSRYIFVVLVALLVCIQRVVHKRHTILQVIVGGLLGLFYGLLYISLGIENTFIVSFIITILLVIHIKTFSSLSINVGPQQMYLI